MRTTNRSSKMSYYNAKELKILFNIDEEQNTIHHVTKNGKNYKYIKGVLHSKKIEESEWKEVE
jgi:hypothetical protein